MPFILLLAVSLVVAPEGPEESVPPGARLMIYDGALVGENVGASSSSLLAKFTPTRGVVEVSLTSGNENGAFVGGNVGASSSSPS